MSQVSSTNSPALSGARLMGQLATRFGVDPQKLAQALKNVCFRQSDGSEISTDELLALAVVCQEYQLNPFLKEIYAFRSKTGVLMPLVSIDGWLRIMNRQPDFDGFEVRWGPEVKLGNSIPVPQWCEVLIFRKNLSHPIVHREWMIECHGQSFPWKQYPRRMLKHRAIIQCIRYAFGVSGALDEESFRETEAISVIAQAPAPQSQIAKDPVVPLLSEEKLDRCLTKAAQKSQEDQNFDPHAWIERQFNPEQREKAHRMLEEKLNPLAAEPETAPNSMESMNTIPSEDDGFLEGI